MSLCISMYRYSVKKIFIWIACDRMCMYLHTAIFHSDVHWCAYVWRMYMHIFMCVYTCTFISLCVYIYVYVFEHLCIHWHVYICMKLYISKTRSLCMCVWRSKQMFFEDLLCVLFWWIWPDFHITQICNLSHLGRIVQPSKATTARWTILKALWTSAFSGTSRYSSRMVGNLGKCFGYWNGKSWLSSSASNDMEKELPPTLRWAWYCSVVDIPYGADSKRLLLLGGATACKDGWLGLNKAPRATLVVWIIVH